MIRDMDKIWCLVSRVRLSQLENQNQFGQYRDSPHCNYGTPTVQLLLKGSGSYQRPCDIILTTGPAQKNYKMVCAVTKGTFPWWFDSAFLIWFFNVDYFSSHFPGPHYCRSSLKWGENTASIICANRFIPVNIHETLAFWKFICKFPFFPAWGFEGSRRFQGRDSSFRVREFRFVLILFHTSTQADLSQIFF
jgi:hypothetical protein